MVTRQSVGPDRASDTELVVDENFTEEEPTKEETLEGIRRGMEDVKAGRTRPARQAIAEIRDKLAADADSS